MKKAKIQTETLPNFHDRGATFVGMDLYTEIYRPEEGGVLAWSIRRRDSGFKTTHR
jgi:hypothetical protein